TNFEQSSSESSSESSSDTSASVKRRWWFAPLAICLGVLPLIVAEVSLRMTGGASVELDSAIDADPTSEIFSMPSLLVRNDPAGQWEVSQERYNFFRPAAFPIEKAPGTRRIFALGGSTVQGRPYAHETAFPAWLKLELAARGSESADHSRDEIVNLGGVSYASYRVEKILDEVLLHQPDVIVLYTGHNEFLEDRTYASLRAMNATQTWATKLGRRLHTVRWLQQRFASSPPKTTVQSEMPSEVDTRLDHAGGLESYQRDPQWRQAVEQQFHVTLQRMIDKVIAQDVSLVLCVPASDLVGTPPIKVTNADFDEVDQDAFETHWQVATDAMRTSDDRIAACLRCIKLDPQHAGAHFIAGRLSLDLGRTREAREYLTAARDFDVCPLRATTPIMESVRSLAAKYNVPLIQTDQILDQWNVRREPFPDGISDPEKFIDHVHPSIVGHQRIAKAIADVLVGRGTQKSEAKFSQMSQDHLTLLGEDYFIRGKQRLQGLQNWAQGRAGNLGL
ncbi:SGNH/GDSL hydrolase family protein, partial [Stieleria varia]